LKSSVTCPLLLNSDCFNIIMLFWETGCYTESIMVISSYNHTSYSLFLCSINLFSLFSLNSDPTTPSSSFYHHHQCTIYNRFFISVGCPSPPLCVFVCVFFSLHMMYFVCFSLETIRSTPRKSKIERNQ